MILDRFQDLFRRKKGTTSVLQALSSWLVSKFSVQTPEIRSQTQNQEPNLNRKFKKSLNCLNRVGLTAT